jgi:CHAT domain-containing protein
MAPVQFDSLGLSPLSYSQNEITFLESSFAGDYFTRQEATKDRFMDQFPSYNMVHLATHADAQDETMPWIAFSDGKLTLNELYLKPNQAEMVVLSGCNTTLGEQAIGEGVISLARGFFYGGTQSVVSSLWNINDQATPYIMDRFYGYIKDGKDKATALSLAKQDYLTDHSLSETSPYYWASFVLLGSTQPIGFHDPWLLAGISIVVLLGFGLLFFRRR